MQYPRPSFNTTAKLSKNKTATKMTHHQHVVVSIFSVMKLKILGKILNIHLKPDNMVSNHVNNNTTSDP